MIPFAKQVIAAIQSVVGPGPLGLHEPVFRGNEWLYLKECLDSTYVASQGRFIEQFEIDLARYTGADFVIAVASGTAALHIALKLAGVSNRDEVLVPALTFVATANAVTYCGATPHFVDCDVSTLGVDIDRLREHLDLVSERRSGLTINKTTGRIIRAIIPVHMFGHPVNLEGLLRLASDYNLAVIEDAAESIGSFYAGQHTGTFGLAGALSFNGNKTITTGGGGAILTNSGEFATQARHLTRTAKVPDRWEYIHDQVGYNYRLPNLNAALGCAQLEQLPGLLKRKRDLFHLYNKAFDGLDGVDVLQEPEGCQSNYWLQTLVLGSNRVRFREDILEASIESGFEVRPPWRLIPDLKPYNASPRMEGMKVTEIAPRLINIPSHPSHL
jgi:perosamine synthetase